MAQDLNLAAIAITDHDTIDGAREALVQGMPPSLQFVPGVEISAAPYFKGRGDSSYHILGYFVDPDNPELNHLLAKLQKARSGRNPENDGPMRWPPSKTQRDVPSPHRS